MSGARKRLGPDRRLAPRPLAAHLTSALSLWISSRAGLPLSRIVSLPSSPEGRRLAALARDIDAIGYHRVAEALERAITADASAFAAGLDAYRRHPYRRPAERRPILWQAGTTRLLDYSVGVKGPPVLVIPSLINRFYVLDLLPQRSFLRHLARRGLRPLVIDWGAPGDAEHGFGLGDYVALRLDHAFEAVLAAAGGPVAVIGYCMGGLLALALAARRRSQLSALALFATPWDFHSDKGEHGRLLALLGDFLPLLCAGTGTLPVEIIQFLFFALDPFLAKRKFIRFSRLDPGSAEAASFVALEDWINDGVPLTQEVARECARSWYGDNEPSRGLWKVAGDLVRPASLDLPALVVLPDRDRIVPPESAAPLAREFGRASVLHPPLGHVGMMAGSRAAELLWTPVADWLAARLSGGGRTP